MKYKLSCGRNKGVGDRRFYSIGPERPSTRLSPNRSPRSTECGHGNVDDGALHVVGRACGGGRSGLSEPLYMHGSGGPLTTPALFWSMTCDHPIPVAVIPIAVASPLVGGAGWPPCQFLYLETVGMLWAHLFMGRQGNTQSGTFPVEDAQPCLCQFHHPRWDEEDKIIQVVKDVLDP